MRVGVFDMGGGNWTGGITYLRNLGHAVRTTIPEQLNLFLVRKRQTGQNQEDAVSAFFDGTIEVVPFGASPRSPLGLFRRAVSLLAGGDIIDSRRFEKVFARENLQVLFGNGLTNKFRLPSVGWFPDFQHVDLPQFFDPKEVLIRNLLVRRMANNCTIMVFSSEHARNRFAAIHPAHANKARVLHFVAHLPPKIKSLDPAYVLQKLRLPEKFTYLPNQFWKHKNHLVAFEAVKILRDRNQPICLACSGNPKDPRNPGLQEQLLAYIKDNALSEQIRILGLVDFDDVYALIRQSCGVLNPSLYEGWSTTVEETKTIGKPMILSDLEVHREQAPPETIYFRRHEPEDLAAALKQTWQCYPSGPNERMETEAARNYPSRSKAFAQSFADACAEAANLKR